MLGRYVLSRQASTLRPIQTQRRQPVVKYLLFGITTAAIGYDATCNELQNFSGAFRFMRSMKIAAVISADYSWSLFRIPNTSEEYETVR